MSLNKLTCSLSQTILALLTITVIARADVQSRFSTAGFYALSDSPRTVANFNPGWRFYKGDMTGAEAIDFDDSQWEAANLPHGLEILGENASGGRNYQGIAWYRKQFTVDSGGANDRVFLYFEAIMGAAQVWVNGRHVAEHYGGYLPFAADITDVLKPEGQKNVVAVKADNSNSKLYPPGQPQDRLDFTYMGGIYRDTYLIQTGPVHVTLRELSTTVAGGGVFPAVLDIQGKDAEVEIRTEVMNTTAKSVQVTVKNTLVDAAGQEVASIKQQLKFDGRQTKQLHKQAKLKDVRLWHPDDPYLHFVHTEVLIDGKLVDSLKTRFGIRLFEMRGPEGLFVNKEWIGKKIVGANRHQDYRYVGNALPNSGQWRDVKLLREGGASVIRAAHYPQDPAFYDACDEFGVLTTTANPGWHFFNFKQQVFEERLFDDTRQLVRRDRSVASMLLWEVCINEFPSQPDYAMKTMHDIAHAEYPFPGLFTVADHHEAIKGGFDMHYNCDGKDHNAFHREYGDGGEVDNWYSQNARQRIKMEWGEKALIQQSRIQEVPLNYTHATSKAKIGGTMWCGIDHHRGYHPDPFRGGWLNGFRRPRYTYYLYQSQYDPDYEIPGIGKKPMVHLVHEFTQVSPADIVVYSNCDEVRLTYLGKEIGTQKPDRSGNRKNLPHPPFVFENAFDWTQVKRHRDGPSKFKNAEMVAEGLIDGKVVARHVKPYAQRTTGIKLQIADEGMVLTADGSDFVPVHAAIVDQYGTKKVLASEHVYFTVEGPAEIIGDRSTFANPMKTEFGVATVLVRATTEPGEITVKAYSQGLESDEIRLTSQATKMALLYDPAYVAASKKPATDAVTIITAEQGSDLPTNVKQLQAELQKLRLDMVGKDQTIMELQSQLGQKN